MLRYFALSILILFLLVNVPVLSQVLPFAGYSHTFGSKDIYRSKDKDDKDKDKDKDKDDNDEDDNDEDDNDEDDENSNTSKDKDKHSDHEDNKDDSSSDSSKDDEKDKDKHDSSSNDEDDSKDKDKNEDIENDNSSSENDNKDDQSDHEDNKDDHSDNSDDRDDNSGSSSNDEDNDNEGHKDDEHSDSKNDKDNQSEDKKEDKKEERLQYYVGMVSANDGQNVIIDGSSLQGTSRWLSILRPGMLLEVYGKWEKGSFMAQDIKVLMPTSFMYYQGPGKLFGQSSDRIEAWTNRKKQLETFRTISLSDTSVIVVAYYDGKMLLATPDIFPLPDNLAVGWVELSGRLEGETIIWENTKPFP